MKKLFILLTCFILTMTALTGFTVKPGNTGRSKDVTAVKAAKIILDEPIFVRVLILDKWWIFVYLDGSLINIYPDEDE